MSATPCTQPGCSGTVVDVVNPDTPVSEHDVQEIAWHDCTDLLSKITVGEIRKGVVKNIADFGAFVDLGGIDGLLHITDMSYGRINHPSEVVKPGQ